GSVATDHLQTFEGKFSDSLVPDQLDKLAVSFLVDDLDVRRGGCAANISFGLGSLGLRPTLVAAVGRDFVDQGYRAWLENAGVDCSRLLISPTLHTALCTDRKSTRLNSSHVKISYALFCLKKKKPVR